MENASKALIMLATMIISILIISLLVLIFSIFKNFEATLIDDSEQTEISKFNAEFLQYKEKNIITPQEIISVANLVSDINDKYQLNEQEDNSLYVEIKVITKKGIIENFEKKQSNDYIQFIKDNESDFSCTNIKINSMTNRVNYIEFSYI